MTLPWRSFTESETTIGFFVAGKANAAEADTAYNMAYREILLSHQWAARNGSTLVTTVDPYSTGTVTATQGSATLQGIGTTFTAAMVGRYVRINNDNPIYKIATFVGVTNLTLETPYAQTTQTSVGYQIFQFQYALASDVDLPRVYAIGNTNPIVKRDVNWIVQRDPNRVQTSSTPIAFAIYGTDSTASNMIEFWPRYPGATTARIEYLKAVADLSGSQVPIIRSDLIEARALQYLCARLFVKFGDPHWKDGAMHWAEVFTNTLEHAKQEDMDRWGLPAQVAFHRPITFGSQYIATHDVD